MTVKEYIGRKLCHRLCRVKLRDEYGKKYNRKKATTHYVYHNSWCGKENLIAREDVPVRRVIARTDVPRGMYGFRVSTVFLGTPVGYRDGKPVMFETSVFPMYPAERQILWFKPFEEPCAVVEYDSLDDAQYTSLADAEAGHLDLVRHFRNTQVSMKPTMKHHRTFANAETGEMLHVSPEGNLYKA